MLVKFYKEEERKAGREEGRKGGREGGKEGGEKGSRQGGREGRREGEGNRTLGLLEHPSPQLYYLDLFSSPWFLPASTRHRIQVSTRE